MILLLRDDLILETFDSADSPPDWVEWIDVVNGEYSFCDDEGHKFRGELVPSAGPFKSEKWRLIPDGKPEPYNAILMVERAVALDPLRSRFDDLATLRRYLAKR